MILLSLAVSTALMAAKFLTYHLTLSSAVLSDALESIINVVAGAFAFLSVWMSAKPPDPEHPYGHGKIEYFSAGFEGALIIVAAVGIFYSGIQHLKHPRVLPNLEEGLIILIAATAVNLLLGICLMRVGRRTDSITLISDGKHILTDVYTSGGVLLGLVLVFWTGRLWSFMTTPEIPCYRWEPNRRERDWPYSMTTAGKPLFSTAAIPGLC